MTVDKLKIDDPRVKHCQTRLNGRSYHYLHAVPPSQSGPKATVILIHGWPDLSFGWRYQIPLLLELGLEVVAPDLMGFGGTDAPYAPPGSDQLRVYGMKQASDDIAALAAHVGAFKVILGGHDWGGAVVFRVALYHPELVTAIFSICTPYSPPSKIFLSLDQVIKKAPQFGYQKQLAGPEVEARINDKTQIRRFLNALYSATTPAKEPAFDPKTGVKFDLLPRVGKSRLLTDEEMDYYVQEYSRHGMHGNLNWYRTRRVNYEDELSLRSTPIHLPVLFVAADRDSVLLPSLSKNMERYIPRLTRRSVPANHWALWQTPELTNNCIREWFKDTVFGKEAHKL